MSDNRLYIATRDPRIKGGVPTMAGFVYEVADAGGYDPCLVANAIDRETDVRVTDLHRLRRGQEITHTTEDGMEVKLLSRILPELEVTQYVTNRHLWRQALADGDAFYGVGGINQCCLPLVREGSRFGAWIATTLWEDRKPRLGEASLAHRVRDRTSKPFLERLESKIFASTTDLLVLSRATKRTVVRKYGLPEEAVSVVPYPVDTEQFSPSGERALSSPSILFVGRINDDRKNVPLLIGALERTLEAVPDATLTLIGEAPDSSLERFVARRGLEERVEFVEFVPNDELPKYYRSADVFCIPSNQEGLAIVGLEAMACGTPVVSTRCGGPEDYVHEGETGYLVPTNDEGALSQRVTELLNDEAKRRTLGENARSLVEAEYARADVRDRFRESLEATAPHGP